MAIPSNDRSGEGERHRIIRIRREIIRQHHPPPPSHRAIRGALVLLLVLLPRPSSHLLAIAHALVLRGDGIVPLEPPSRRRHRRADERATTTTTTALPMTSAGHDDRRFVEARHSSLRRQYARDGGVVYRKSALAPEVFEAVSNELRSSIMTTKSNNRMTDEGASSSFATLRIGARVSREDSPTLYDAIGREGGSLLRLVNAVAGSDGSYSSMVLAPDVPVEVRVYEKIGAGMGWHVDDVLYRPEAQVEVVLTLENTSDCSTMWRTPRRCDDRSSSSSSSSSSGDENVVDDGPLERRRRRRIRRSEESREYDVRSIETTPNSALILRAGGVEHMVTPLTSGRRTILKMAFVHQGSALDEDMAVHASHHRPDDGKRGKDAARGSKRRKRSSGK